MDGIGNGRVGNGRQGNRRAGNGPQRNRRVGNRQQRNSRVGNRRLRNNRSGNRQIGNRIAGNSNVAREPRRRIRRTLTGLGNVRRRFINKNNTKKIARLAAMGIGAATLGTIGLAAGIASDNDKDILTYTGLGLGAGSLLGQKSVDGITSLGKSAIDTGRDFRDEFQQGYYGEEYEDKKLNPRLDKEWSKDKDVIKHFQSIYGVDYKKQMQNALALRKAGITDQNDIDTALKLHDKNEGLSIEEAANIMQFSKDFSRGEVMRDRDKIKQAAMNMLGRNASDETAERVTRLVEQRFKLRKAD